MSRVEVWSGPSTTLPLLVLDFGPAAAAISVVVFPEYVKHEDAFGEGRLVPCRQSALPWATRAPGVAKAILQVRLCQPSLLSGVNFNAFADFV